MELSSRWPVPAPFPCSNVVPMTQWAPQAVTVGLTGLHGCSHRRAAAPGCIRCEAAGARKRVLRTCKNCKKQFDPALNQPTSCRFHTAHFGGETKRKFESVYTGGTMNTPDSGEVFQYWHCCGSEDPFDAGCTAAPHYSYDE